MNGQHRLLPAVDPFFAQRRSSSVWRRPRFWAPSPCLSPADVPRILPGYLTRFSIFWDLSLGSCVLLMIHGLTGGRWGMFVGRSLSAAVTPLPLLALLFLPIAFGVEQLYPWAAPTRPSITRSWPRKPQYLNVEGFELRAGVVLVCGC